jgi:nitronate monooxygenase
MSKLPPVLANLPLPVIGSPLFIISNPKLVIAQCKAGVVGAMPALNARPASQLDDWLARDHRGTRGLQQGEPGQAGRTLRHQPDRAQEQRPARARHGRWS